MGLFSTRTPRKFRPVRIYSNERQEKLNKLVDDIKRAQGELSSENKPYDPTKFKGTFSQYTPRAKNHKEYSKRLSWPLALILILILIFVWHFLLTGEVHL